MTSAQRLPRGREGARGRFEFARPSGRAAHAPWPEAPAGGLTGGPAGRQLRAGPLALAAVSGSPSRRGRGPAGCSVPVQGR